MLVFSKTDIGKKRELNEDYIYTSGDQIGSLDNLFVVADGMGGHKAGDFASENTVIKLVEAIKEDSQGAQIPDLLNRAIDKANHYIYKCSISEEEKEGMGSTLVLCTIKNNEAVIANVGDSRLYIIREGKIRQITRDHSFVEEMVSLGKINREEARNHPDKNIITRAIGVKDSVSVDIFTEKIEENDKLLLCSDGLTNMLADSEILEIIENNEIKNAVETLIERANDNGGRDNIAVVLVEPFGGCND